MKYKETYIYPLIEYLQTPFPNTASRKNTIRNIVGVGIFISLFIYYFFGNTFELHGYSALYLSSQFGVVTILGAFLYDMFVVKVLKLKKHEDSWTFLNWILYMTGLLLFLAQINYGLFLFHTEYSFELASFWEITQHTLAVGILPVIFSGYISKVKAEKLQAAAIPVNSNESVILYSKNQKQKIRLDLNDILYVEALENYVHVHFLQDEKVEKTLLRNTLKSMVAQLAGTSVIQCHRSFMVNSSHIKQVKGNAQGLKLKVHEKLSRPIPVSRKFIPLIKEKREALSFITKA